MELEAYANIFQIEERLWWYRGRRDVCFPLLEKHLGDRKDLESLVMEAINIFQEDGKK